MVLEGRRGGNVTAAPAQPIFDFIGGILLYVHTGLLKNFAKTFFLVPYQNLDCRHFEK